MKRTILTGIIYRVLNCSVVFAQQEDTAEHDRFNNFYMMFGYGKSNKGISAVEAGISLQYQGYYFKIKGSSLLEPYEKDRRHKEDPVPGFSDLNFMAGKSLTFLKNQQLQVGTGLSLVHETVQLRIDEPGYYTYHNKYKAYFTFGLPLELRYNFFIGRNVAFSVVGHGNANAIRSYCSASAGLMVGMF